MTDRKLYDVYRWNDGTTPEAADYLMTAPLRWITHCFKLHQDAENRAWRECETHGRSFLHFNNRHILTTDDGIMVIPSVVARSNQV